MTEDGEQYTPPQFREYQDGHGVREPQVDEHTGLVRDAEISRYLSMLKRAYEPESGMPARFEDTELFRRIIRNEGTDVAREALENGDMPSLKHFTGDQGQRTDLSGMNALTDLMDMVDREALLWYIFAPPGNGKTNFACLGAQIWSRTHPDGKVASNIRTLQEQDRWIDTYPELMDWFKQDQDAVLAGNGTRKLFIFDEASSHASGRGETGATAGEKLAPLVYKIRKYGGSIIIVGHDGKDVHPAIRVMATAVEKESEKEVTFWESVDNRKGRNQIQSLEGVPPTKWRYNDKEATNWKWTRTSDDDEEDELDAGDLRIAIALRLRSEGRSTEDTADFVGRSQGWVSNRWTEYTREGKHEEKLNELDRVVG